MKTFTRDSLQRMFDGQGRQSSGGSTDSSVGISYWKLDENGRLYTEYDVYSQKGISALGAGSQEGGGILGPLLTSLNSENMPPAAGYLHWTGSAWEWSTPSGGGGGGTEFDEAAMWQALASSNSNQIDASHLADALSGYATQSWIGSNYLSKNGGSMNVSTLVTNLNANYLQGRALTSGNNVTGGIPYITDAGIMEIGKYIDLHASDGDRDYATRIVLGSSPAGNVLTLPTSTGTLALTSDIKGKSWWGRTPDGTGAVTGQMNSVGSIYMDAGAAIFTDGKQVLGLNTSNNLVIGYEASTGLTHDTYIDGTDIKFRTGTTERNIRMFINGSGNVGIGTTSPAYLLDVNGNAHFSSIYADGNIHLNQGQQIAYKIDNTYRNTITVNANELAIGYGTRPYRATRISGQSMHLYTYSGSAAAERLTILEGGNVGIGTTSPAYLLDVNGVARCTSIRIGDALLAWDSTNNALKVVKSDGTTACNFYATGGVSALGAGNGQIETLQVGTLELTSVAKISANSSNEITLTSTGLKLSDNTSKQLFAVDSTGALTIGSSTQGGNLYIYYNGRRYQLNISQAISNGILS